jgi:hypothetical protein
MKTIKLITHFSNILFVILCFIFAIVHYDKALIGYFFLGIYQIVLTLIITISFHVRKKNIKSIIIYWLMVATYFILIQRLFHCYNQEALGFILFPSLIALYNCYLTDINIKEK